MFGSADRRAPVRASYPRAPCGGPLGQCQEFEMEFIQLEHSGQRRLRELIQAIKAAWPCEQQIVIQRL